VADRAFSSLPAVADRLLFQGAGAALQFFTGKNLGSIIIIINLLFPRIVLLI
jgi:hypothetical protein